MKTAAAILVYTIIGFCAVSCSSPSAMTPQQLQSNAFAAHQGKIQNDVVLLIRQGYNLRQIAVQLHITEAQAAQYANQAYAAERSEMARRSMLQYELTQRQSPPPVAPSTDSTEIDKLKERVDYAEQLAIDADHRSRQSEIEAEEKERQRALNRPPPKPFDPWHP